MSVFHNPTPNLTVNTPNGKRSIMEQIRENLARKTPPQTSSDMATNDRNVTSIGTGQVTVTSTAQQVGIVSRLRSAIKLTNLSATTEIWWGTTQAVSPTTGDLIPAGRGQWVSIPGPSVIWVVTASSSAAMSWAEKYADND